MKGAVCAVFDIDDTLYLERDYVRSGFEAVGQWAKRWLSIGDFTERCWIRFVDGQRGSIFDQVLQEVHFPSNPELISTLVEIYRTHVPSISLAEDALQALSRISEIAAIAVISDGPAACQSRKVEALDLRRFASPVILTGILGKAYCKPHCKAFQDVEQSKPATHYFYIADNPIKDFQAPKLLGWTTVRVRRPQGLHYAVKNFEPRPDYEMADCSGTIDLISHL